MLITSSFAVFFHHLKLPFSLRLKASCEQHFWNSRTFRMLCRLSTWMSKKIIPGSLCFLEDFCRPCSVLSLCWMLPWRSWSLSPPPLYFILIFPHLSCHYFTSLCLEIDPSESVSPGTVCAFRQAVPRLVLFHFPSFGDSS